MVKKESASLGISKPRDGMTDALMLIKKPKNIQYLFVFYGKKISEILNLFNPIILLIYYSFFLFKKFLFDLAK